MKTLHLTPLDSIQKTLDNHPGEHLTLILEPGIYYEKLYITHNNLTIKGIDLENTIISNGDYNYKFHEDGLLYNTFRTSTIDVIGTNVLFENITIENSAGPAKKTIGQAIALSVYGNDFKAVNCHLKGNQDTLFIGPLPTDLAERYFHILPLAMRHTNFVSSFFKNCSIYGNVDFIFGSGTAFFDNCDIHIINTENYAYIAAPSTYESYEFGFVFNDCKIINHSMLKAYLARPWREHGKTYFLNCSFEGEFYEERYQDWDKDSFSFQEFPYIESKLSKKLNQETIDKILKHLKP